jgi:hypothetical protein
MRRHVWVPGVVVAALAVGAAGCGSGNKTVPVKGTVTLDGKPISLALVMFVPGKEGGMMAQGVTDKNGEFELTTYKPNDGALPGDYQVTVTKVEEAPTVNVSDLPPNMTPAEIMQKVVPRVMAKRAQQKKKPSEIPEFYADGKKSPLLCRVPADGKVNLALQSGR